MITYTKWVISLIVILVTRVLIIPVIPLHGYAHTMHFLARTNVGKQIEGAVSGQSDWHRDRAIGHTAVTDEGVVIVLPRWQAAPKTVGVVIVLVIPIQGPMRHACGMEG